MQDWSVRFGCYSYIPGPGRCTPCGKWDQLIVQPLRSVLGRSKTGEKLKAILGPGWANGSTTLMMMKKGNKVGENIKLFNCLRSIAEDVPGLRLFGIELVAGEQMIVFMFCKYGRCGYGKRLCPISNAGSSGCVCVLCYRINLMAWECDNTVKVIRTGS